MLKVSVLVACVQKYRHGVQKYRQGTGMVYRSTGMVYRSTGMVYRSIGMVYRSTGMVYRSTGMVYRSIGMVYRSTGMCTEVQAWCFKMTVVPADVYIYLAFFPGSPPTCAYLPLTHIGLVWVKGHSINMYIRMWRESLGTMQCISPVEIILEPLPLRLHFAAGEQELTVTILNTPAVEAEQSFIMQLYTNSTQIVIPPETKNTTITVKELFGNTLV